MNHREGQLTDKYARSLYCLTRCKSQTYRTYRTNSEITNNETSIGESLKYVNVYTVRSECKGYIQVSNSNTRVDNQISFVHKRELLTLRYKWYVGNKVHFQSLKSVAKLGEGYSDVGNGVFTKCLWHSKSSMPLSS